MSYFLKDWKFLKNIQRFYNGEELILQDFLKIQLTDHQKWMILSSWTPSTVVWLCSRATGKSFMASVFLMTRSLLLPNTNSYIMRPSGGQAQETFQKMEDIAKGNIASLMGTSSVFLDECVRMNSSADPFTHAKTSYSVSLYNGSTINTLNSVAKNIVGIRSNMSVFDEAGEKILPLLLELLERPQNFIYYSTKMKYA